MKAAHSLPVMPVCTECQRLIVGRKTSGDEVVTFLFWNTAGNASAKSISSIAHRHSVDFIILAEFEVPIAEILSKLNPPGRAETYTLSPSFLPIPGLAIFSRLPANSLKSMGDLRGISFRHLIPPVGADILLAVAHLNSKLFLQPDDQAMECPRIAQDIRQMEARIGHSRTILVGDLNMDPFEAGVVSASGLHAVMTRHLALQSSRKVQGVSYPFFYNPMWSRYGHGKGGPVATYFKRRSTQRVYFWHMFDQLLVRPSLLDMFDDETLHILDNDGLRSLHREDGTPDREYASDHFPILFTLALDRSKDDGTR
jgi:hypothetical protein